MKNYSIEPLDKIFEATVQIKIDNLAKPINSLGKLELVAKQIATIQHNLTPELHNPHHLLLMADHGIVDEGVSPSPKEITWQQALNIQNNGAGINIFATQHNIKLISVDVGVDYDFPRDIGIIDKKIRKGTRNFLKEPALTTDEIELCMSHGEELIDDIMANNCNVLSIGELGIGNTSAASIWMSLLTKIPLDQCVGSGSGGSDHFTKHKLSILNHAIARYKGPINPTTIMCEFGGLELIMATAAMLRAAELKMIILIDGFLMGTAFLMAYTINSNVKDYAIFTHQSNEKGHKILLKYLNIIPLLDLNFCLGEGTGALCAYPLIESSIRMLTQMKSFDESKISLINKI